MIAAPDLSYRAYRVWQRNRDTYLRLWKTESWPPFIEAIVTLVAFGYGLGSYVALGDENYIQFLAPGLIAQAVFFGAVFETTYGSYFRMEMQRTFDAMVATPVSVDDVIAGEILWAATRSLIAGSAILLTLLPFGLVQSPWALLILPGAVLAGIAFGAMGMVFTALTPSINGFNYFFTLFVTPNIFFGAIFFPIDRLPPAAQGAVWFVPLSHVGSLFRALNRGEIGPGVVTDVLWLVVVGSIVAYVSLALMRRRLIK